MKKIILFAMFITLGFNANAQFSVGANFGIPVGDTDDIYNFPLGIDVNYMFASNSDFKFGIASGYSVYFGDEFFGLEIPNASFLPIAAAGRYGISEKFSLGADVGYAIGLAPDGNDGGFYYKPMLAYEVAENISLILSYSSIDVDGLTFSNFGLGVMFALN